MSTHDKRITLVYEPYGGYATERAFDGVTDDDLVFTVAALAGRRFRISGHGADMEALKESRHAQLAWYADRMTEALYVGLGRWRRVIPVRVRVRVVQMMMDYLKDVTASWTAELIGMHAEVSRSRRPAPPRRASPAPTYGVAARCSSPSGRAARCEKQFPLGGPLPEGWKVNAAGHPACPEHPFTSLVKR